MIAERNEDQTRGLRKEIERAVAGLSDNSGGTDEVTKAQVERMRLRIEEFESGLEQSRSSTNNKLNEIKVTLEGFMDSKLGDTKRLIEK